VVRCAAIRVIGDLLKESGLILGDRGQSGARAPAQRREGRLRRRHTRVVSGLLPSRAPQRRHRSVEVVDVSLDHGDEGEEGPGWAEVGRRLHGGLAGDVALVMWSHTRRFGARSPDPVVPLAMVLR